MRDHEKETLNARLKKAGFENTTVKEFLSLTDEDMEYIEFRLALTRLARERRKELNITQEMLARKIKTSQSRLAKMEAGDEGISLDFIIKALLALGASRKDICQAAAR